MARTLVVYYSRTGNTRRTGRELAEALGADVEELSDGQDRRSAAGYLKAGLDARTRRTVTLAPLGHDPAMYDPLVVASPIRVSTVSTPVRAFLTRHCGTGRRVAWFCTYGLEGEKYPEKAFRAMSDAAGLEPLATLSVKTRDVEGEHAESVAAFVDALNSRRQAGRQKGQETAA